MARTNVVVVVVVVAVAVAMVVPVVVVVIVIVTVVVAAIVLVTITGLPDPNSSDCVGDCGRHVLVVVAHTFVYMSFRIVSFFDVDVIVGHYVGCLLSCYAPSTVLSTLEPAKAFSTMHSKPAKAFSIDNYSAV